MKISFKVRRMLTIVVFMFVISSFVYIIANPPLSIPGISYDETNDGFRVVELRNNGLVSASLRKVIVNGSEIPSSAELGVSRSGQLVLGGALDESLHISFHRIDEYKINPALSPTAADQKLIEMQQSGERDTIFHYGLRVLHDKPIETITIKYSYLGLPFSHKRDVSEGDQSL